MAEKAFLPKGTLVLWLKRGRDSLNEVGGEEKSRKREGLMSPFQLELYPYGKRRSLKSFIRRGMTRSELHLRKISKAEVWIGCRETYQKGEEMMQWWSEMV